MGEKVNKVIKLLLIILCLLSSAVWADYTKQIDVFGIPIIATDGVSDTKMMHAASVMAEYLDNDQDGKADDPKVIDAIHGHNGFLYMAADESEEDTEFPNDDFDDNQDFGQNLFAEETRPEGSSAEGGFDATLEEVLHLITHVGYANAYPNKYGEDPGSELTKAMDKARGGQFFDIPSRYPAGAWYTYDDDSCNYNCMATEYFYWSLTSLLGAQSYPDRADEIEWEWRLSNARKLNSTDKRIYNLLTTLPIKTIPTGKYTGSLLTIKSIN
jgi:hypothetical protein